MLCYAEKSGHKISGKNEKKEKKRQKDIEVKEGGGINRRKGKGKERKDQYKREEGECGIEVEKVRL